MGQTMELISVQETLGPKEKKEFTTSRRGRQEEEKIRLRKWAENI